MVFVVVFFFFFFAFVDHWQRLVAPHSMNPKIMWWHQTHNSIAFFFHCYGMSLLIFINWFICWAQLCISSHFSSKQGFVEWILFQKHISSWSNMLLHNNFIFQLVSTHLRLFNNNIDFILLPILLVTHHQMEIFSSNQSKYKSFYWLFQEK